MWQQQVQKQKLHRGGRSALGNAMGWRSLEATGSFAGSSLLGGEGIKITAKRVWLIVEGGEQRQPLDQEQGQHCFFRGGSCLHDEMS